VLAPLVVTLGHCADTYNHRIPQRALNSRKGGSPCAALDPGPPSQLPTLLAAMALEMLCAVGCRNRELLAAFRGLRVQVPAVYGTANFNGRCDAGKLTHSQIGV
jgi:hypothetical protein